MDYITCAEAAKKLGVSTRRIQQLCNKGLIYGAEKRGKSWMVPARIANNGLQAQEQRKPLPIGISDYKDATTNYYYVDKTLLIRDFIDKKPKVSLFTRPRRFGKTLNMDMLRVYFEKTKDDTSVYFTDKEIWKCGDKYTKQQGQFPVIFFSFKDVKCGNWQSTYDMLKTLISFEFRRHIELKDSEKLSAFEKDQYVQLARGDADAAEYQLSLQTLSLLLHKHHERQTIIIIDEYDTPIQQGDSCGFYTEVIDFMRNFFSGGLKDNSHLAYGFLTGILRVAKESIFSGLNNLTINSILDKPYSAYFGFTKDEVKELLEYYGCSNKYDEICEWYDGYLFGETEIFNPWSVVNYIAAECFPKAFWQSTGSNDIIGEIVSEATDEITLNLYRLLNGETVTSYIDTSVIYPEVRNNPHSIYSFLLVAGYLKIVKDYPQHDGNYMCDVSIPNKEISFVYEKEVLNKTGNMNIAITIQQVIFSADANKLQELLEDFMLTTISSFDGTNERFYHGLMLGLCVVLSNQYRIKSNTESGFGRFDIELIPIKKTNPGFIFEFKYAQNTGDDLEKLAEKALMQIEEKKYDTELRELGVSDIVKIGIAFKGKKAVVKKAQ